MMDNHGFFMVNPHNIFLNALGGFGTQCLRPRRCGIPSVAIIPEKVIQPHHKAQGQSGGTGTVPSDKR